MKFIKSLNIDFLGKRKISFVASVVLAILSIGFLFVRSPQWGTDFTGGTLIHLKLEKQMDTKELRTILEKGGIGESNIQQFRNSNIVIVRVSNLKEEADIAGQISAIFNNYDPDFKFEVLKSEMVGPAVGEYLREKAVKAFIFAFIGMILYVAWRFAGGIWGFAAVIALLHDVIITFGILNFLGITIDLQVVAALLTLAGYSINDTIVIYDRIRENLRIHYKKSVIEVMNESISSTLSRTIITSGTTLAVVLAIFLKGGAVLHGFSLALLIGIVVGTYSSIFVASPLVYVWQNKK